MGNSESREQQEGSCIRTFGGGGWFGGQAVWSTAFAPRGALIATGQDQNMVKIWGVSDGKCQKTITVSTAAKGGSVYSVAFSFDEKYLLTASSDTTAAIWQLDTGARAHHLKAHTAAVWTAFFSPTSSLIVTASFDQTAKIWGYFDPTADDEKDPLVPMVSLTAYPCSMEWASFLPKNEKKFVTCSGDGKMTLWDLTINTGRYEALSERVRICWSKTGHASWIKSAAFSPRQLFCPTNPSQPQLLLATVSGDKTAKIWQVSDGKCLHTLTGHEEGVFSTSFSRTGECLATGSYDSRVKIWKTLDGSCLLTLKGSNAASFFYSVSFSSVGDFLLTGSADGRTKMYKAPDSIDVVCFQCVPPALIPSDIVGVVVEFLF